jgi:hypothetical protein
MISDDDALMLALQSAKQNQQQFQKFINEMSQSDDALNSHLISSHLSPFNLQFQAASLLCINKCELQ